MSKCENPVLKNLPEVWSPEGIMKSIFDKTERNEKKCTSNTNPDIIWRVLRQNNEWCDVEEVPPPRASIFWIQFQKRSSVASMSAPASMSFVGCDGARLISARSVPRVGKTASCQRAWKSTCIFYTQQKCFFVR